MPALKAELAPGEEVREEGDAEGRKRIGRPEDIAAAILYLASDDASFVTGVALPVDGGYTAA